VTPFLLSGKYGKAFVYKGVEESLLSENLVSLSEGLNALDHHLSNNVPNNKILEKFYQRHLVNIYSIRPPILIVTIN